MKERDGVVICDKLSNEDGTPSDEVWDYILSSRITPDKMESPSHMPLEKLTELLDEFIDIDDEYPNPFTFTADASGTKNVMKATELIQKLQSLIEEHGDLDVYSIADYEFVEGAYVDESYTQPKMKVIILD